ncbi:enoyl-CoA hydratase/isomerase family protein [Nocardia gamkensis]|uniref:enoyl-CoA hydratase/isomerase family protein n=1 Tax=Nocardia gamkensis TaxID=352869 RepID=UPI0036EE958E
MQQLDLEHGLGRVDAFSRLLSRLVELPAPSPCPLRTAPPWAAIWSCCWPADYVVGLLPSRLGMPEINHGLFPSVVSVANAMTRLGARTARDVLLSGRLFDVQEALELGVVDSIADSPAEARDRAGKWVTEMAAKPRVLVAAAREALWVAPSMMPDERLGLAREQCAGRGAQPLAQLRKPDVGRYSCSRVPHHAA